MRTLTKLLVLLFLAETAFGLSEQSWYVDPDAAGGATGKDWANAYLSLSDWEAAEANDLTVLDVYIVVYCKSSGGTADSTYLTIDGFTTDATRDITIIGTDFPSTGVFDSTKYRMARTDGGLVTVSDNYVTFQNVQFQVTESSTGTYRFIQTTTGTTNLVIDSCILKGVCSGTGAVQGVYSPGEAITIYNTVIYDIKSGSDVGYQAIRTVDGTITLYNCTLENNYYCYVETGAGSIAATNNIEANYGTLSSGSVTRTTCQNAATGGDWENDFVNITTDEDYDLESGSGAVGAGTDDPGGGFFSDDICGRARSDWDIGAFEYTAPAVGDAAQVIRVIMF